MVFFKALVVSIGSKRARNPILGGVTTKKSGDKYSGFKSNFSSF